MTTTATRLRADQNTIRDWLHELHGNSGGLLHVCSTDDWTGQRVDAKYGHQDAISYIMARDAAGFSGCYLRATTLRPDAPTDRGKRAGATFSASLPGLWADIDIAGPGHKHTPNHPGMPDYNPNKALQYPLPSDVEAGYRIVTAAGLPQPTLWIHSGGGLYPWWLLGKPEDLCDQFALEASISLSDGWQKVLEASANQLGMDYGNVGDLARVLRIPGTVNRKDNLERPCRILEMGGPRYTFDELTEALAISKPKLATAPTAQPSRPTATVRAPTAGPRPDSPLDAFEVATPWADILEPWGWTFNHTAGGTDHWTRPGKRVAEGTSATTGHSVDGRDRMWVFSTSAGLPSGESLTKPKVWGILNGYDRGDNMGEVAKALVGLGFGTPRAAIPVGCTTQLVPSVSRGVAPSGGVQLSTEPATVQPEVPLWNPVPTRPGTGEKPLPTFPVDCLPPAMADQVRYVAASRQVDPTMPAMFALSMISAVSANKLQVWGGGEHYEPLSLYTCTVAESGERKSPTGKAMFGALRTVEKRMAAAWNDEIDRQVDELDQQRALVKNNPAAANRLEDQIIAVEAGRKRPPRIQLPDDITPEAMTRALSRQGGHGAILDPEGTYVGILCGRYSSGKANPDIFIKSYDGDRSTTARISRDDEEIGRPTMAMAVAIQQVVMDDLMADKQLMDRGAVARMIFAFPESLAGKRSSRNTPPIDTNPGRIWNLIVEGIAEQPIPDDPEHIPAIALSPDAQDAHCDFSDTFELRLGPGGDMAFLGLKEWANKHVGRVLRIAALLHLADGNTVSTEISLSTYRAAVTIGDWAIEHARKAHGVDRESVDEATVRQCAQVLDWVARSGKKTLTNRDARRGVRGQWVNTKAMGDALDQLTGLGWLMEQQYRDGGNRQRTRLMVSPYIHLAAQAATM